MNISKADKAEEKVLNPTVVKLGLVSLFADISSEMLYPITPIFLTTVLGASMTSVGLIEGCAEMFASLLKTYSGLWSDRISQRKPFVALGYLLSALAKPLTGMATSWTHVLMARGADRIGKGIRGAPRDALLAEAVVSELRGSAFGWHRAMDTLGAAIGPLLAIIYLTYFSNNLRSIYYLSILPGLLAVYFVLIVHEKKRDAKIEVSNKKIKLIWNELPKNFRFYIISWGVFSLTNSSDIFLLMKAKEQGLSLNTVIFMYCFYNLSYSLMSPTLGKLSDQKPKKNILIFGLILFSIVYLGFSWATESWHFWALFGIYGIYMASTDGVGKAFAVDLINPEMKATGLGALSTVTGLATIIASAVAGYIWDHWGSVWTFVYGALGAVISVFLFGIYFRDVNLSHVKKND